MQGTVFIQNWKTAQDQDNFLKFERSVCSVNTIYMDHMLIVEFVILAICI